MLASHVPANQGDKLVHPPEQFSIWFTGFISHDLYCDRPSDFIVRPARPDLRHDVVECDQRVRQQLPLFGAQIHPVKFDVVFVPAHRRELREPPEETRIQRVRREGVVVQPEPVLEIRIVHTAEVDACLSPEISKSAGREAKSIRQIAGIPGAPKPGSRQTTSRRWRSRPGKRCGSAKNRSHASSSNEAISSLRSPGMGKPTSPS